MSRLLIVGLGNPILGDDGVGWRVAQAVAAARPDLEVVCLSLGGLSLMERLIGYEHAIVIDAIHTPDGQPGAVTHFELDDLPEHLPGHMTAAHDTSLQTALKVGRSLGAKLPTEIEVVAVEARRIYDFSETLSPPISAAVPFARDAVLTCVSRLTAVRSPVESGSAQG